jgi:hypothetical protein
MSTRIRDFVLVGSMIVLVPLAVVGCSSKDTTTEERPRDGGARDDAELACGDIGGTCVSLVDGCGAGGIADPGASCGVRCCLPRPDDAAADG